MSIPLEVPSDQFDLVREPGEAIADAAQRDLFEFFSAPQEEGVPALDAAPAAEPGATIGDYLARHEEVRQDGPARGDVAQDEPAQDEPAKCEEHDEIAAVDRSGSATGSAAGALDEVSRANLRRLEETVSWLQSEAYRLPPAAPLPPVPGLPALEPIIDRSTLDRTLQRSPVLPIWLQEQQTRLEPPPPRERGVFWPRAVKFVMACAIAAPLSYYFAVATSPLHKHLSEGAGVALLDTPAVPELPTQRPPEAGDGLHVGAAGPELASAEARAAAPGQIVRTAALKSAALRSPPPESPVRSSAEAAAVQAPAAQAPAAQAPVTDSPVTEAQAAPPEPVPLPPVRPPQAEATQAQNVPSPATTGVATDMARSSAPPAEQDLAPAAKTVDLQEVKLLTDRGKQFFEVGDLIAARILFMRAANAGDAAAAVAMGATYDPVILADRGVRGVAPDLDKARSWYERAEEMGSPEGPRRLEMLANR
jgi:hypothetical protein